MGHVIRLNNKEAHVLKQILNSAGISEIEVGSAEHQAAEDLGMDYDEVNEIATKIWRRIKPNCWKPYVNVEHES